MTAAGRGVHGVDRLPPKRQHQPACLFDRPIGHRVLGAGSLVDLTGRGIANVVAVFGELPEIRDHVGPRRHRLGLQRFDLRVDSGPHLVRDHTTEILLQVELVDQPQVSRLVDARLDATTVRSIIHIDTAAALDRLNQHAIIFGQIVAPAIVHQPDPAPGVDRSPLLGDPELLIPLVIQPLDQRRRILARLELADPDAPGTPIGVIDEYRLLLGQEFLELRLLRERLILGGKGCHLHAIDEPGLSSLDIADDVDSGRELLLPDARVVGEGADDDPADGRDPRPDAVGGQADADGG